MIAKTLTKVLVLGIDSGEPSLMTQWAADGLLPNMKRLLDKSTWGRVANPRGFESGAAWPTFQTAKTPGNFGQYEGPRYFNPQTYEFDHKTVEQTPPDYIWQRLTRAGKRCFLLDPPYVPLDPAINGAMLIDWGPHLAGKGYGRGELQSWPPELAQEAADVAGTDPFKGEMCDSISLASAADYREFVDQHIDRILRKAKLSTHFLKKGNWDYFQTVFPDLHCVGHRTWHISDNTHPNYDPAFSEQTGNLYREAFVAVDQAIGEILSLVDEQSLTLLYLSHGMRQQRTGTGMLDRALARIEGQKVDLGSVRAKSRLKSLWRQTPPELRSYLKPLRRQFRGAFQTSMLLPNRRDRRFFEVHNNKRTGGIRINLMGREAEGKVAPEDFDAVLNEVIAHLTPIKNAETGTPLIEEFIKTKDLHNGEVVDFLPDLLVRWDQSHPIKAITSDTIGTIPQDFESLRTGDHSSYGLFAASGGGILRTQLNRDVRAEDFGGTLMEVLGVPATDTDGTVIEPLMAFAKESELAE